MVSVNQVPFCLRGAIVCLLFVDEIAPLSVEAESFLGEGITLLCFIALIALHINAQLVGTVGELAAVAVGANTFFSEVFAQGSLYL